MILISFAQSRKSRVYIVQSYINKIYKLLSFDYLVIMQISKNS